MLILLVGVLLATPLVTYAAFSLSGIIIAVVGNLSTIAMFLFNAAVDWFVLRMGALITGTGASGGVGIGTSIDVVWKIVRDLVNLTFIFGLVYVGFKTILDAGTDTKKMLASIIVSALLVNFSLFISKVVIDISNITAVEIYRAMQIAPDQTAGTNLKDQTIGDAFLIRMGIKQLFTVPNAKNELIAKNAGDAKEGADTYLAYIIGASLFVIVAAFVFAAGAILLAIRFGVLIILMILSPIAFAATVFPAFKAWRDKWWHTLFSQAFFAPAYLFMLYITLQVANGYRSQMKTFDGLYDPNLFKEGFATAAFFCLTIVLMIASLIIAKQMGAYGAARAVSYLSKAGSYAGNKVLRGTLYPMRLGARAAIYPVRAGGRAAVREASRIVRKAEFAEGKVASTIRKIPFVTTALQKAGTAANTYAAQRRAEFGKLRTSQKKHLLDSFGSRFTPLDRLAIYQAFQDSNDLDELTPDQIRDYRELSNKYEVSQLALNRLRPDVVIEKKTGEELKELHKKRVGYIKLPSDFTALHKVIVDRTAKDGVNNRNESVNAMLDAMIETFNGGIFAAAGRRGDNVSLELFTRLRQRVKDEGLDNKRAESYVTFFEKLATDEEEKGEKANRDFIQRNRSAADEFRKGMMARLINILPVESAGQGNPQSGGNSGGGNTGQQQGRRAQGNQRRGPNVSGRPVQPTPAQPTNGETDDQDNEMMT